MKIRRRKTVQPRSATGLFCRPWVALLLAVVLPGALVADDAGALLRTNGTGVMVNKNGVPASIALLRDDLIETQRGAVTRIEIRGSTADLDSDSMVQFEGDELMLDHGSLSVNTSRGLRVRIGCLTITPVNTSGWTQYDVVDRDGKVTVSARKSDVYVEARSHNLQQAKKSLQSEHSIVRESEQKSRDENCDTANPTTSGGVTAGTGGILNSPWAVGAGAAVMAGVGVCIGICWQENPVSPSKPANKE